MKAFAQEVKEAEYLKLPPLTNEQMQRKTLKSQTEEGRYWNMSYLVVVGVVRVEELRQLFSPLLFLLTTKREIEM